eukprot:CAMPEP_0118931488 /NCGR_PEP_ID=MMETSP1169-20130426/7810_1 /TAXON_ID=36882 /ORGANISM="Pyramimonas obovata, Strain CCMP722" /LENGTH=155 /DNA_ID=CAMNT_0006873995 /DNA_START=178 /DNA_END=643 /DNA_ORIENTATION=+
MGKKKTNAEKKASKKVKAAKAVQQEVEMEIEKDKAAHLLKAKLADLKASRLKTTKKSKPNPSGESRANPKKKFGRSKAPATVGAPGERASGLRHWPLAWGGDGARGPSPAFGEGVGMDSRRRGSSCAHAAGCGGGVRRALQGAAGDREDDLGIEG